MTFPKRWLEDDDAAGAVRDVLRSSSKMDPPEGAQQAVWLAIAGQIGAAGAGGAAAGGAAAGGSAKIAAGAGATATATATAASSGLIKAIFIGALSGIVAVSGYSVLEPAAPPAPAPPPVTEAAPPPQKAPSDVQGASPAPTAPPPSAPSSTPVPAGEARDPAPPPSAPIASATAEPSIEAPAASPEIGAATPVPGSPEERASRLREESELTGQARAALRSGDPGRAMQILEQARQKFPGGMLGQEREALAIEALAKSGAREAASARAAAFIKANPSSPHAARLQAFVLPQ